MIVILVDHERFDGQHQRSEQQPKAQQESCILSPTHAPDFHVLWFASYVACAAGVTLPLSPVACRWLAHVTQSRHVGRPSFRATSSAATSPHSPHAQPSIVVHSQRDRLRREATPHTCTPTAGSIASWTDEAQPPPLQCPLPIVATRLSRHLPPSTTMHSVR
jgi:hypothetical protein